VLAPLRVLDLSRLLPGPMACRHLADLGAQVLKVEPPLPGRPGLPGDDAAFMGAGDDGVSHFYRVVNHGKRRLTLDLKDPAQLDHLRALVAEAHAVVEGFRPGVMERLGLGYEALRAINPAIVLTRISGYGQQGIWRWPAWSTRRARRMTAARSSATCRSPTSSAARRPRRSARWRRCWGRSGAARAARSTCR